MRRLAKASSVAPIPSTGCGRRTIAGTGALLVLLVASCLGAPQALAATGTGHAPLAPITGAMTPAGSFGANPESVLGIDESAGKGYFADVYVAGVVNVFDLSTGAYLDRITTADLTGTPFGTKLNPTGAIAVDNSGGPTNGQVYVASVDPNNFSRGLIFVFDSAGNFIRMLDGSDTPGGSLNGAPTGLAVEDSTGRLYASDFGNVVVNRFSSSGAYLSRIALDPADGAPAGLDFDSAGNLYLNRYYHLQVEKYGPAGNFLGVIDSNRPASVAVDRSNDHVYVGGNGYITEYDSAGAFVSRFANGESNFLSGLAVDSSTGRIYDAHYETVNVYDAGATVSIPEVTIDPVVSGVGYFEATVAGEVDPGGAPSQYFFEYKRPGEETWTMTSFQSAGEGSGAVPVSATLTGLQSNSEYLVRLVGTSGGREASSVTGPASFTTEAVPPPVLTIDPVSAITGSTAHFSGSFDPEGVPTSAHFEYRTETGEWTALPDQDPVGGSSPVPIEADVKGLVPSTTYFVRLVASNPGAFVTSSEVSFATETIGPLVYTGGAAPRTETGARLNGWITPRNSSTTYYFEFGPTESYGTELPASKDAAAGAGTTQVAVSAQASGLSPGTTYHFRLVAENAGGKSTGADQELRTRSGGEVTPRPRGVELVNTPDKGNQPVVALPIVANPDATRILWTTNGGAPGGPTGSGNNFLAERSSDGWHSRSLLPPASQLVDNGEARYIPRSVDPSFRDFVFEVSSGILTAPLRTLVTLDDEGNQRVLGPTGKPNKNGLNYLRASDDFSRVYSNTEEVFDPARHPAGTEQVYDFSTNPPTLATVMADGNAPKCGVVSEVTYSEWAGGSSYEWASTKPGAPARLFFESHGNEEPCGSTAGGSRLYMRDLDAGTTTLVSGPALPGGPQSESGMFVRATDDGSEVLFAAASRLSPEDDNDGGDLYIRTLGAGVKCLTCVGEEGAQVGVGSSFFRSVMASNDLSYVYFESGAQLLPDVAPQGGIYLWHEGTIRYVGATGGVFAALTAGAAELTDDGRVLLFNSQDPQLTTDATGGTIQVFRYSAADNSLECISCSPGRTSTQPSELASQLSISGGFGTSADDGNDVVFRTRDAIDPRDINGDTDIYEWRNGQLRMVTDGVTQYPPGIFGPLKLVGVGRDGANIVFTAGPNLTGYERDNVGQLYVAREGGGFPPPPLPPAPCGEESCQGPLQAPPAAVAAASAAHGGPGNVGATPRKRQRCASGKVRKRGGRCVKARGKKKASKKANRKSNSNKQGGK